jgi:4-hydroxy-tetrahydrodipicolinate reductase
MLRVVIAGAAGRMGHALTSSIRKQDGLELVGAIEYPEHPDLGADIGTLTGGAALGVPLTSDVSAALEAADVLIVFTSHTAVPELAKAAARMGRAVVIGTTALTPEEDEVVSVAAGRVPIVSAPNMSLGVNVLFAAVKKAASVLGNDYEMSIEDVHHVHKLDAPSGTALRLGEKVAEGLGTPFEKVYVHDEEGQLAEPPAGKLVIRSFRRGEVVGDHTVAFQNEVETVEFTHHAWSRECLAVGALHAAKWVVARKPRLYDMQDVLGLQDS